MRKARALAEFLLAVALPLLAGGSALFSCKTHTDADALKGFDAAPQTVTGTEAASCQAACDDTDDDADWAACYACRCKAAMDGWLPTPAELSCERGAEIVVYKAHRSPAGVTLSRVTQEERECFNPPRFAGARRYGNSCAPGSRLGQLRHGDVFVKWICRREKFHASFDAAALPYEDTSVIAYNARTGATCFWDDKDGVVAAANNPPLDVADGDTDKVRSFLATYRRQEGEDCVGCHDNDPFLYSPYLQSARWQTDAAFTDGPYRRVTVAGQLERIGQHLTSKDAEACTRCHRIGRGHTCAGLALDSLGNSQLESLQAFLREAAPENWGLARASDDTRFPWPVWMPINAAVPGSHAAFFRPQKFGKAAEALASCCADPEADGCQWTELP
jgi:hypothetical protein